MYFLHLLKFLLSRTPIVYSDEGADVVTKLPENKLFFNVDWFCSLIHLIASLN